jgi:uncharacterized protein YuzE
MKVTYDKTADVLRIVFASRPVQESDEVRPGVIADFDADGAVLGLEILDASERVEQPAAVELAVSA